MMKPLAFGFRLSAFLLDHVDYQQSTVLRPKAEGRISSFLLIPRSPMTYPHRLLLACSSPASSIGT